MQGETSELTYQIWIVRIVFVLIFIQLLMKNHLEKVSPSHFLQNILIETSNVCFKNFLILYFAIS